MRTTAIVTAAVISLSAFAAIPAIAAPSFATYRPAPLHQICLPPDQLEKVCVQWAPAQPGQLFGACLKYRIECVAPAHIQ